MYWPTIGLALLALAAGLCCLGLVAYLYLPKLVTERLPARQIQRLGFADFTGRVSRIGLHQTAAGPFIFGHVDRPAISIQSVAFDYSLSELRQKKIGCLRISGMTVNAIIGPGGFRLPGLDTGKLVKRQPIDPSAADTASLPLDMLVDKIEIRSAMVILRWNDETYRIPFEADLRPDGPDMAKLATQVRLFPCNQQLVLTAAVDLESQVADLNLNGSDITLGRLAGLMDPVPGLDVTGEATVHARARLQLAPVGLFDAVVDLAWNQGRVAYQSASIIPGGDAATATFSAVSGNLRNWDLKASGLQFETPAPVAIHELTANLVLDGDQRALTGEADVTVLPFASDVPWPALVKNKLALGMVLGLNQQASGDWSAEVSTRAENRNHPADRLDATIAGIRLNADAPGFNLTANGHGREGSARWNLNLNSIRAAAAGTTIVLPSALSTGQLQFKRQGLRSTWFGHGRIQLPASTVGGLGINGQLDDLVLSASFQGQDDNPAAVDTRLRLAGGWLQHKGSGLKLSGTRLDLPYGSRPKVGGSSGSFSVDRIVYNSRVLGDIQGRVTQQKHAFVFNAAHSSSLFPDMTTAFTGTVRTDGTRVPDAVVTVEIPPYELPADSDLGPWVPAAEGVTLSGTVSARGNASFSSRGVRGDLELALQGGVLRMAQKQISVEGIDARLHFPELPRLRSAPAQSLRFARAAMGGIVVDGGRFAFQLEPPDTLFVEKGRLSWCDGTVDAQSLRILSGKQDYQLSLYCQRLELSRILEQLGSVNARGTGTVNGRIPIVYSNGRIRFDDGFLFSTPGETGRIQLTGTDILTRGIPAGTPQFAQVELAREALKDYAYNWAKLGMVSEGEDFVMRLQFDGKPANPLPFIYKKDIGSFVRVEAGAQGSIFQGISLDVNLRLPLNQLLQYKDIVKMIQ